MTAAPPPRSLATVPSVGIPYQQIIGREQKGLFLFLISQSAAMQQPFGDDTRSRAEEAATVINGWLAGMIGRLMSSAGIRDWLDIAIFGYGTDAAGIPVVEPVFSGELSSLPIASIAQIDAQPARMDRKRKKIHDEDTDEVVEVEIEVPVWLDPRAQGKAPMCRALYRIQETLADWIADHPRSFPPVVLHITDGVANDGDPRPDAQAVKGLTTEDGNVLLFSCGLAQGPAEALVFPPGTGAIPRIPSARYCSSWRASCRRL